MNKFTSVLVSLIKVAAKLRKQEKIRAQLLNKEDLTVPPILIMSITNDCNLSCKGCYANEQKRCKQDEMSIEDIDRIIGEGLELGIGIVFIHISSTGRLEPCPFAPISDVDLKQDSFKKALESNILRKIRDNHHLLEESEGGCALYENKQWINNIKS